MTPGTAARRRAWNGPAILSFGFRPFFLGGAVWAAFAMALWAPMLSGRLALPTRLDPVSWHAHELLFGYLGAIMAGFLLTAVPNWTGRLPVTGWPLGGLAALWLAGRIAIAVSAALPWGTTMAVVLAFPVLLSAVLLHEIVAGRNWKNLLVFILLALLTAANALFLLEAMGGGPAAHGPGLRLGLGAAMTAVALIGGRVVPSFTRNWLAAKGMAARPAPPMQRFDKAVLAVTAAALGFWVVRPDDGPGGIALIAVGGLNFLRLARWKGWLTGAEPLVWVLHAGYAFLPLGAVALGSAALWPNVIAQGVAQHLWMAGAIGLMTLAVMTRATLGHTGRTLHAGPAAVAIYSAMILSVLARLGAGVFAEPPLLETAALLWIAAFAGFAIAFGPLLVRKRPLAA